MADNDRRSDSVMQRLRKRSPALRQVVGFFALLTTGGISACVGGVASTGVVIALVMGTPVFLFFSPILVPAGIILFLCVGGVLAATTAGVAALSFVSWLYNIFHGRNVDIKPDIGALNMSIEAVRQRAKETAEAAKEKARELAGGQVQSKVQQFEAPATAA